MARGKRFLRGLSSSYLLLLINTVSTLVSLPLALHFLDKNEYTVWLLATQVAAYLSMIDLGTTGSGIRLLVDYKDTPATGVYGSLIKSMFFIQVIQAGVILLVGIGSAPFLPRLLKNIPPELVGDFHMLWIWQIIFLAVNFAFRVGNQILTAHQRLDISNYAQIGASILNLALLFGGFHAGLRLYSFVVAQGISMLLMLAVMLASCVWLRLLPPRGAWGSLSRVHLKRLFVFGSDFFLMTLGSTLTTGSQVFLLTRLQNLDAALIWSVMTKLFTLGTQIVWRVLGAAWPAFSEMFVRGETERLRKRYRLVFELSLLLGVYLALLIAFGNSAFVDIWTKGRVHWPERNDWLLAIWFVLCFQAVSHNWLLMSAKRLQIAKFIYLFESAAFIATSIVIVPVGGITAMLSCSVVCAVVFSVAYGTRRVAQLFNLPLRQALLDWLGPAARFLMMTVPIGILLAFLTRESSVLRLAACVVPLGIIAAVLAVRFCLSGELVTELISHVPAWFRRAAKIIIGRKADASITRMF